MRYNFPGSSMGRTGGTGASANDLAGWTRTTTLSPELQRQFDLQNQLAESLQGQAVNRAGQLSSSPFQISDNLPQMVTGLNTQGLPGVSGQLNTQGLPQMASGIDTSNFADMATSLNTEGLPDINKDYSQDANAVEKATYDRLQQLMNPGFQERQRALESQLAATGNPLGSEAYNTELNRFQNQRQEADLAAALESVGAGRAEQSRLFDIASRSRGQLTGEQLSSAGLAQQQRQQGLQEQLSSAGLAQAARQQGISEQQLAQQLGLQARQQGISEQMQNANLAQAARQQGISEDQLVRNQQINELAALIQGSPAIQTPTSAQPAQYQVAAPDIMGAQQFQTQTQLQNALAQQQANSAKKGGTSGLAGTIGSALITKYSDRRLKENIKPSIKVDGHQYYTFDWNEEGQRLGMSGRDFGVMADEIEQYAPNLVSFDQNGYKMVNYHGLH